MHEPNQAYGDYSESDNSGWGQSNGYGGSSGYEYSNNDITQQQNAWGDGATAYTTDSIINPYVENPYEVNFFDNAYTETFSNPNPCRDYDSYKSNNSGFELE